MTPASLRRRTLSLTSIALMAGSILSASAAMAVSTIKHTYKGPTLNRLRVTVQVSIVVKNKTIIKVKPTVTVRTARSRFINDQIVPILNMEVLQAQSAGIDVVSGATITSDAYLMSLQAAVNKARNANAL